MKTDTSASDHGKCPNCGACKCCGRGGYGFYPYPYFVPYPTYQNPLYPPTWIVGGTTTAPNSLTASTAATPMSVGTVNYGVS